MTARDNLKQFRQVYCKFSQVSIKNMVPHAQKVSLSWPFFYDQN